MRPGPTAGCGLLEGRRVLVVGGGIQEYGQADPPPGIGAAIATQVAHEGAGLVVGDIDLAAAGAACAAAGAGVAVECDASEETATTALLAEARRAMGGLDGLVLNVGVSGGIGFEGTGAGDWDRVMAVNVRSHFLAIKRALPDLAEGSSIVLVSSTGAILPSTHESPAYAASKAALAGLMAFAAHRGAAAGVRVNTVMPGIIDTPLGRLASLVKPDRDAIAIPLGQQGSAWQVADAVVFLLSDRAAYISGQALAVDGGLSGAP
ncbi:MAG: SDR family NAD(P)-dependent oxidoreductase [Solirubrobacterales bacterium]